jgi:hypothetical protein
MSTASTRSSGTSSGIRAPPHALRIVIPHDLQTDTEQLVPRGTRESREFTTASVIVSLDCDRRNVHPSFGQIGATPSIPLAGRTSVR